MDKWLLTPEEVDKALVGGMDKILEGQEDWSDDYDILIVNKAQAKKLIEWIRDEVLEECDEYQNVYLFPRGAFKELCKGAGLEMKYD